MMAKGKYKRRSVTCVREDRISNLTSHLIDSILERLPLEEAVRTSTLSKTWRHRWTTMKAIVFDEDFTNKFTKNREFDCDGFTSTINQVLSKNAVKNIIEITENHPYEVPSNVFSCPGLTKLLLETCFFKPPLNFEGFFNLTELTLDCVLFGPSLYGTRINLPQLKKLCLSQCIKASNFNIKTTKLHDLLVITCRDANFLQLLDNPYLKMVGISFRLIQNFDGIERLNLVSMLSNLPRVEDFLIEGNFLKFLSAEKFPKWLPRAISSLKLLMLADIQLGDLDQLHGALCLLRNSPNVEKLSIIHTEMDPRVDVGPALNHLETPNCLDYTLKQLQTVEILQLEGSRSELLFIKLLLANSPYLEKMTITPNEDLNVRKVLDIAKDVMRFPRASPKAEIIYLNPMY